jgi:putative acetyltransferase
MMRSENDSAGMIVMPAFLFMGGAMAKMESILSMEQSRRAYPPAKDPRKVGKHNPFCESGGGTLYRDVLEYRVWVHSGRGDDVCRSFGAHQAAREFSESTKGAEVPLVLVLQNPWIRWNGALHDYELVHENRIAEWRVEWLFEDMATGDPDAVIARLRREHPDGTA